VQYIAGLARGQRPQSNYLDFADAQLVGPLEPLTLLSPEGAALFTAAVLAADTALEPWTLRHTTRANSYPELQCPPPELWVAKRYGYLPTRRGPRRITDCVGPDLDTWADVLSVADTSLGTARALGLPAALEELAPEMWAAAFETVDRLDEDLLLGTFYAAACLHADPPELIHCRVGLAHQAEPRSVVSVIT
jgi:hypothetical protein